MTVSLLDPRVPAVLLRIDRNPFHHGTLGAVRSLGRCGVEVHAVAESAGSPVPHSRFLHRMHPPPRPGATPGDIAAVLRRVAARVGRPAVLIPMDDASAIAVSRLYRELTDLFLLPSQPGGLPERVADKAELAEVCRALDLPHPVTLIPESPAQAAAAAWQLGLPVVAKWSRPWLLPPDSDLRSTTLLRSAHEAEALYRRTGDAGSRLLLQAYLPPGPRRDWFFHGYADRSGTVHGGGSGWKHRAWPPGAGLTAEGRWLPNPRLRSAAEDLVRVLGYRGILDLDFRLDPEAGTYHLLDFNPRPGAQFRLFADATGLDVVRALHLDLTHRSLPEPAPLPGRTFVVENYAPLAALRTLPAPGHLSELAWYAPDDRAPGLAMAALWSRHVAHKLPGLLRRTVLPPRRVPPIRTPAPVGRQAGAPDPAPAGVDDPGTDAGGAARRDDEKASSC
ncbi:ATP-grasp domain-containing protein [Streptomyces sp. NPDC058001]|uniref:carboxylate--amine ligase n=1 Tax=Streptomyces sp. NPDC058001 TaxID=3346300 RepID=UPI0036EBD752